MPSEPPKVKLIVHIILIYSSNKDDSYQLCCYASPSDISRKYKQSTHTPFEFFYQMK